jgi:hypothetical protein
MAMKEISTVIGFIVLLVNSRTLPVANKVQETVCPSISVACARKSCDVSPFHFIARIRDAPPGRSLSYQWSVSSGEIVSGEGTRSIKVVAPKWSSLTASLNVIGLPPQCASTASMSVIREHIPTAHLFDQFSSAPFAKVSPHLDAFADQLRNQPGAMGYILFHGGRGLAEGAKRYLLNKHDIEAGRIVNVRKKRSGRVIIKLYIVPTGAVPPAK